MNGLNINKGFELMIPKEPEEHKEEALFDNRIQFSFLKRMITFSFQITKKE